MSKLKQPSPGGGRRVGSGEIRPKRGDTLTLGLDAFKKISAVEGIRVSRRLVADLRSMAKEHPGESERSSYISSKYGKK